MSETDVRGALREIISQIDQGGDDGKVFARDACIARARAALAVRPAPTVKALKWSDNEAASPVGFYRVQTLGDKWEPLRSGHYMLPRVHGVVAAFDTKEEAKAAAERDYESRVLSALDIPSAARPAPTVPEGYTAQPPGARCKCIQEYRAADGTHWCCNGRPAPTVPEDVANDDHARGCQGREYSCTCGYDDRVAATLEWAVGKANEYAALADAERRRAEKAEAEIKRLRAVPEDVAGLVERLNGWFDGIRLSETTALQREAAAALTARAARIAELEAEVARLAPREGS